jgi:N-methylhydantoinase A
MKSVSDKALRIGVDIGGTFTDFVVFSSESKQVESFKLLSTPEDPSKAVLQGIEHILERYPGNNYTLKVIHGSTVATNALLEGKGASTALVTTHGFRDVIEIGRQNRPELYRLPFRPTPPLVPRQHRIEIHERIDHKGNVQIPLQNMEIEELISSLAHLPIESVAICLLFSFINPKHEKSITERLRQAGYFVSPSIEVLPEFREYERASTTVINAYVTPVLDRYLKRLDEQLKTSGRNVEIQVMQSNGGNISLREARRDGVHCILSGPAGGIIGAEIVSQQVTTVSGNDPSTLKAITFDMGGTSTDVSLIDVVPRITTEAVIGGYPIRIPVLDIHTIGAGGGSIASSDAGGALRVGPQSAGAKPGPACYGLGDVEEDRPTVTDANLVLGRLASDYFLGGEMPLYPNRAWNALRNLGEKLNLDPIETALGIIQVVNAHMARAIRLISVERGYDPRDFTLVSFGGAGGLHASDLAREVGIPRVLVPTYAATLSAFGMLGANVIKDYSRTVMLDGDRSLSQVNEFLGLLAQQGLRDLENEGFNTETITLEPELDTRYGGQSYELVIPYQEDYLNAFHEMHRKTYGYARQGAPVEIVNVRLRATGVLPPLPVKEKADRGSDPNHALIANREVYLARKLTHLPFYNGDLLTTGNQINGPAIVLRTDTTILINKGDLAKLDGYGNLLLQIGG